jgi:hypothetical protein
VFNVKVAPEEMSHRDEPSIFLSNTKGRQRGVSRPPLLLLQSGIAVGRSHFLPDRLCAHECSTPRRGMAKGARAAPSEATVGRRGLLPSVAAAHFYEETTMPMMVMVIPARRGAACRE